MTQTESNNDIADRVESYVGMLKKSQAIRSPEVERAFRSVPRHKLVETFFVPARLFSSTSPLDKVRNDPFNPDPEHLGIIYSHHALLTRINKDGVPSSSTSMPGLVAEMLELLRLRPGQKVLEIGAGTGYNAALMAELVGSQENIVTVDIQQDVVDQTKRLLKDAGYEYIKVLARDGFFGVADEAPFDRIIATVGLHDISPYWAEQLSEGGEMLLPLYQGGACPLFRVTKKDGRLLGRAISGSGFMPIQGKMALEKGSRSPQPANEGEPDIQRRPGWDLEHGIGGRWDLFFFVTASDRRASLLPVPGADDADSWSNWTFGLRDFDGAVVIGADELVLVGEAEALLKGLMTCATFGSRREDPRLKSSRRSSFRRSCSNPTPTRWLSSGITSGRFSESPTDLARRSRKVPER